MIFHNDVAAILLPMVAHVSWTALLYGGLTIARAPIVWGLGQRKDGANPWEEIELRIGANLSNQFEWPLLFYVACILGINIGIANKPTFLILAWIFLIGRIGHSLVQIFSQNIRLRGIVFTVNFLAVIGMWGYLFV